MLLSNIFALHLKNQLVMLSSHALSPIMLIWRSIYDWLGVFGVWHQDGVENFVQQCIPYKGKSGMKVKYII